MDKKKVKQYIKKAIDCIITEKDHVNAIDALIEADRELSKSDWVSVENGLPEYMEKVWVTDKEHRDFVWISHRENGDIPKRLDDNGFPAWQHHYPYYHITHWRKIDKLED